METEDFISRDELWKWRRPPTPAELIAAHLNVPLHCLLEWEIEEDPTRLGYRLRHVRVANTNGETFAYPVKGVSR